MFFFYPLCTIIIWLRIKDFDITFVCSYSGGNLFKQCYFSTFCYVATLWLKKKKKRNRFGSSHVSLGGGRGGLRHSRRLHFPGSVLRVICLFQQFLTELVQEADAGTFPRCSVKNTRKLAKNWGSCCVLLPAVYPALQLILRHLNACITK